MEPRKPKTETNEERQTRLDREKYATQKANDEAFGPYWTEVLPGKLWSRGCAKVRTIPPSLLLNYNPPPPAGRTMPPMSYSWPKRIVPCPKEPARCTCGFLLPDCLIAKYPTCEGWDAYPNQTNWTLKFEVPPRHLKLVKPKQSKLFSNGKGEDDA